MSSSLIDDELSPPERQAMHNALHDAVIVITRDTVREDPQYGPMGHAGVLAARESASFDAAVACFRAMDREDLIDEWTTDRCQQNLATMAQACDDRVNLLGLVQAWRERIGPERLAAAASVPFTAPKGREASLLDMLAQTPYGHEAALDLMEHGALASSARSLINAIVHQREDLVTALLAAGAPANGPVVLRSVTDLPLGMTARTGHGAIDPAVVNALNDRIGEQLIAHGANVNRQVDGDNGGSLLRAAIAMRDAHRAAWLLDHGASLDESWAVPRLGEPDRTMSLGDLVLRWASEPRRAHDHPPGSPTLARVFAAHAALVAATVPPSGPDSVTHEDRDPSLPQDTSPASSFSRAMGRRRP